MISELAWAAMLFAVMGVLGFAIFAALFKAHVLGTVGVMFYRGLLLVALSGLITFVIAMWLAPWFRATASVALSAAVLSMSVNLTALVVLPVTIDRSITIFLLGYMDRHPTEFYSTGELRDVFSNIYLNEFRQIDRRMDEQLLSRNVERVDSRYKISPQGRSVIAFARGIAWLFDTDDRFVSPTPDAAAAAQRRAPSHH